MSDPSFGRGVGGKQPIALAVTAGSAINILIRLAFYSPWALNLELPALTNGKEVAAAIVFDLFANLFASVLLYIALDRVFNKAEG